MPFSLSFPFLYSTNNKNMRTLNSPFQELNKVKGDLRLYAYMSIKIGDKYHLLIYLFKKNKTQSCKFS